MKIQLTLISKINIVFIFIFFLLISTLVSYHINKDKVQHTKMLERYDNIAKRIHHERLPKYEVITYLKELDFKIVEKPREILHNIDNLILKGRGVDLVVNNGKFYLHFITPMFRILFVDTKYRIENNFFHFVIFGFVLLLFLLIYILIIKNIKEKDLLLNSRQLFLRTVMHELKTPIAKGRIVSELIDDEKQKNRMINVFEKLNFLIDDFAKVETIVSNNYQLNIGKYTFDKILQNSKEMMMLDNFDDKIKIELDKSRQLLVDLNLISMAIKNLLDNGIKYSSDRKIIVKEEDDKILFISTGGKLPKPLEDYFKPFHNDTKSKNHGMGLGIYIVYSILQMHNMKLEYQYDNGYNIFRIKI